MVSFSIGKIGEREGEKERRPSFSLRFSEFRRSKFIKLRVKVHLLDVGYAYIPKMRDFTEGCSCNCELDVKLLNHQNWTSIAQVMVHFIPGTATA